MALEQDHPCPLLSIPQKYKSLETENKVFAGSTAIHNVLAAKVPRWVKQLRLELLIDQVAHPHSP